ncbi:hypothetical protein [Streptomyces carminius]|uniref:hypothetical protein n=1 Tax=Streptomyces carminius TaxID=2665496 RepID=UPI0013042364|nr:hypothetical protein [Streptomyces carminius]
MTERSSLPLRALPSGRAELHVVLDLDWADIAALGAEAGRLADRLQRAVTLDEAVSHRLSTGSGTRATVPVVPPGPGPAAVPAVERDRSRSAAPASAGSPGAEAGRHAAGRDGGSAASAPVSAVTPMSGAAAGRDRAASPAGQHPAEERRTVERVSLAASPGSAGHSGAADTAAVPGAYRATGTAG